MRSNGGHSPAPAGCRWIDYRPCRRLVHPDKPANIAVLCRLRYLRFALIPLLVCLFAGCAGRTYFPPDIAGQSHYANRLSRDEALLLVLRQARSGYPADYRSFLPDEWGFTFGRTEVFEQRIWVNGEPVVIEAEETLVYQIPWPSVVTMQPFVSRSVLGEQFGIRLSFLPRYPVGTTRLRSVSELTLYDSTYSGLVDLLAALHVLAVNAGQ